MAGLCVSLLAMSQGGILPCFLKTSLLHVAIKAGALKPQSQRGPCHKPSGQRGQACRHGAHVRGRGVVEVGKGITFDV